MRCQLGEVELHYSEHGHGRPLIVLHGAGVDHRETEAAIEAVVSSSAYRRIYLDLPGMGESTAAGLDGNDDVVTILARFIDELDTGPVLLLGHSYGAYLARGVAARHPEAVLGLALLCPIGQQTADAPEPSVVQQDPAAYDELEPADRAGFDEYFVVRTVDTARRYRDHVLPGTKTTDPTALERIFGGWPIELGSAVFAGPTLIVAGRRDSVVGHAGPTELLADYPHAALAVLEDAGHALIHERPELLGPLLADWFRRVETAGTG